MQAWSRGRFYVACRGMVIAAAICGAPAVPSHAASRNGPSAIEFDVLDPFAIPSAGKPSLVDLDFAAGNALLPRAVVFAHADRPAEKIDLDLADSSALSLRFTGRVIDSPERAPAGDDRAEALGRDDERPYAGPDDERRYQGNVRLATASERVRVSSSYRSPDRATDPAFDRVDYIMGTGGPVARPTLRERVDVVAVNRGPLRIASYGQYLQYGPLGGGSDSFSAGDRSRSEFGADVDLKPVKFGVSGSFFATNAEYLRTALTTREHTRDIHAEVALAPLVGSYAGLPSRIGVSRWVSRVDPLELDELGALDPSGWAESQHSTTDALVPSWDWRFGTTAVSLTRTGYRSSFQGQTTDVSHARGVEVKQSFRTGGMRVSFNLAYSDIAHVAPTAIAEGAYRSGAELRLGMSGLPDLNAKGEVTLSRSTPAEGEPYETRHWWVSTGLDFTRLLPAPLLQRSASLSFAGILRDNEADDYDPDAPALDAGVSLMGRIAF